MNSWKIVETPPFRDWFDSLSLHNRADITRAVGVLREIGPTLGRPQVDTVNGSKFKNMKELRVQSKGQPLRIFFAFDRQRVGVLLIGANKKGVTSFYQKLLPVADRLFDIFLEDRQK